MRLAGKAALVTGAAGGIGSAIAARFAAEGAEVTGADIAPGDGIVPLDVTREAEWHEIADALRHRHGRLDALVLAHGISGFRPLAGLDQAEWTRVLTVNATSAYLGVRTLMPIMEAAPTAAIVAIGSTLGLRPVGQLPAYAASKGALINLVKAIATDCARRGTRVRANCIHPGSTETAMLEANLAGDPEGRARRMAAHPLSRGWGRLVAPGDVASAALFLASDEAAYITGIDLPVDGGATI
jgi:NAD(P)-dependent dehydrogenase (short-subunit alcohol dehydrogenase family)